MNNSKRRPAVFLDRDGTINVDRDYLINPAEFEFIDGVPEALKKLQDAGYLLVVVTNQSGVARGYFTLEQVDRLHDHMADKLAALGADLDGIYVCPHHPTQGEAPHRRICDCRKGRPGMLLQAAKDLEIDLSRSIMIGDKLSDIEAGAAAGCQCYLVCTGYGKAFTDKVSKYGAIVVSDLSAAASRILS
jgi:D-glycero-D-manno-heptose 1,7-bisphosphate phosphatase